MTDIRDMTTGEAEAWRRGFEAAKEMAAKLVECRCKPGFCISPACCAREEAAAIRAMEPGE